MYSRFNNFDKTSDGARRKLIFLSNQIPKYQHISNELVCDPISSLAAGPAVANTPRLQLHMIYQLIHNTTIVVKH